jgi:DNA-binding MarR family transcriptional regulator
MLLHFLSLNMPPLQEEIKQSKFRNERHKAIVNVIYTGNWLTNQHSQFLKDYDLSEQQFNILRILRGQGAKPASISLLKERMLDKMSDVSRLVERLRVSGFVERSICPHDRRAVEVVITKKGLRILDTIDKHIEEVDAFVGALPDDELRFLNYLLDKLRSPHIQEHQTSNNSSPAKTMKK